MRQIILIFMIALLPLRGWMGEAMATDMVAINIAAIQAINIMTTAELEIENSMSDCDMHQTKNTAKNTDSATTKTSCTHCQACHAVGLLPAVQTINSNKVQYAQPLTQISQFASALLAPTQKPPIL